MAVRQPEKMGPIFVIGYMHSGTTLLQQILGRHSQVFALVGETNIFTFLSDIRHRYPHLYQDANRREFIIFAAEVIQHGHVLGRQAQSRVKRPEISDDELDSLVEHTQLWNDHIAIFFHVADYLAQRERKVRWLEKTPTHILHIDQILECLPNACLVEIARDPRDILASKKTRLATVETARYLSEERPWKRLEKAYDPLWDTLSWKSCVDAGNLARRKHGGQIYRVRYEDLVQDPEREIRQICDFLSLEYEPSMLKVTAERNGAIWTPGPGSGIDIHSIGRWHNVLTREESAFSEWLAGAEMKDLNYPQDAIQFRVALRFPLLLVKSLFELIQRLIKRWRWGGFAFFLNILISYLRRLLKLIGS